MNSILLLGVGADQIPAVEKSRSLGLHIIGLDGNPNALGAKLCDVFECVDIKSAELVEEAAKRLNKKYGIDGVMAPAVEGTAVGRVVDCLGLRGISEKNTKILTDKIMRCDKFGKIPVPQPRWAVGKDFYIFPCIVKPRNRAGAYGVKYIENDKQLSEYDFDVVQEYLEGWEISTEVLVFDNQTFIAINADRNYDKKLKWKPAVIEDGCQLPSKLPQPMKDKISNTIQKIIDHFNLRSCAIKLDLLIKDNIVYVIECAARMGGGKLSSTMIPMSYGIDWWKLAIQIAMGLPVEYKARKKPKYVAQRYKFADKVESHYDRPSDKIARGKTYKEAIINAST